MLLIIAAVPLETALLSPYIRKTPHLEPVSTTQNVSLLHTGIGPTSTAMTLTRFLEQETPQAVLMIGCGGSYPRSGLSVGDLALASDETFGDLGTMTSRGFLPLDEMNIPSVPPPVQRFQLQSTLQKAAAELLTSEKNAPQSKFACGPFVTVSTCSGQPQISQELEERTGGICENMEGAAAAQVCLHYSIPFLELRGISNPTGTRSPEEWDVKRGAEAAQRGAIRLIENWPLLEKTLCPG